MLIGPEDYDDAGVVRINDETALIQTVDFLTPMVDDPYAFGQIAAANSLSDVYAMGGEPFTVMNVAGFPSSCVDIEVLAQIMTGGAEKIKESGALLVGGHTVDDKEPKYGLSVTGIAKPHEIVSNGGANPGDMLVLTKTLGNGILATAIKAEMLDDDTLKQIIDDMATLNKNAALAMKKTGVHGATDITGFGFLGHLWEMVAASKLSAEIWADQLPIWEAAIGFASMGIIPAGCYANKDYLGNRVIFDDDISVAMQDIMFDPQTSGGLLMAVAPEKLETLTSCLNEYHVGFRVVGKITEFDDQKIRVKGTR